jgi:glycosyltransferase involved in cell wall biosynthesis
MKKISIVSSCYNEEGNVEELYLQVKAELVKFPHYCYEQIFIDNGSIDKTIEVLRKIAAQDKNIKIIVNSRNFGHIRSPIHGILQASGDAIIYMASDLQDPPSLIAKFIKKWEEGYKMALAVKTSSSESFILFAIRKLYYYLISKFSDGNLKIIKNFTGFGLYDKQVIEIIKKIDDPYPYFRGLISEIGFEPAIIEFHQPQRKSGVTKNNFYTLYDNAMLGLTNHSKVPLRLVTFLGFISSTFSLIAAIFYLFAKLIFWNHFTVGIAPIIIGLFFFSSLQLLFIGIIGEYIGSIHTQILKRPLVIEQERINFDKNPS